jgi:hypothetical protein
MQSERSVSFLKRMLLLGVQGIEMLNTRFDPVGVDLDGWSEAMGYSLENQDYDEVIAELYEKYKGAGQMSPEMKLIFMIMSSATMFTITKKISKTDSSNMFTNIINNFMGQQAQAQAQAQAQPQHNGWNGNNDFTIPNPKDLRNNPQRVEMTETTEDPIPSKMKGPNNMNFGSLHTENVDIKNILNQMNERKKEKNREEIIAVETSEDGFKSVPLNAQKRRGRPKKQAVSKA